MALPIVSFILCYVSFFFMQYIQKQIGTLEDGIGKSWALLGGSAKHKQGTLCVFHLIIAFNMHNIND